MAYYPYIILTNSNATLARRFKAIAMRPTLRKMDSIDWTLGGRVDKAIGPVVQTFSYVLRVPQDDPSNGDEGNMADLITFFNYASSAVAPTDVITLTDHYGNTFSVYFTGDLAQDPLTTMLEGDSAWYIIPVTFLEIS